MWPSGITARAQPGESPRSQRAKMRSTDGLEALWAAAPAASSRNAAKLRMEHMSTPRLSLMAGAAGNQRVSCLEREFQIHRPRHGAAMLQYAPSCLAQLSHLGAYSAGKPF